MAKIENTFLWGKNNTDKGSSDNTGLSIDNQGYLLKNGDNVDTLILKKDIRQINYTYRNIEENDGNGHADFGLTGGSNYISICTDTHDAANNTVFMRYADKSSTACDYNNVKEICDYSIPHVKWIKDYTNNYVDNSVKLKLTTQSRNISITQFTNTGKTLDGHEIWEGVMIFNGSGEVNLVNDCTILLGAYLYNITDNRFVSPESVNLRVYNSFQIRASLPSQEKQYRLYFIGVKN